MRWKVDSKTFPTRYDSNSNSLRIDVSGPRKLPKIRDQDNFQTWQIPSSAWVLHFSLVQMISKPL